MGDLLFTLLDGDGRGLVPTDVFFRGCQRMRGQAMASDMHQLQVDLQRNSGLVVDNDNLTLEVCRQLGNLVDQLDSVDRDIIKTPDDERDEVLMARRNRVRRPKGEVAKPEEGAGATN